MQSNDIAIVVVNYFNDEEVMHFVTSEIGKQTLRPCIVIVNNGSNSVNQLEKFCNDNKNIILINSVKNLGYLGAFLSVFDYYFKNNIKMPKWLMLSNADIQFSNISFFEEFFKRIYPIKVGLVGPEIISSHTGILQNPFAENRIPLRKMKLLSVVFSNYIVYVLYQLLAFTKAKCLSLFNKKNARQSYREVYAVHGSFMCIHSEFIKTTLSDLQKAPFLFGEEIHIGEVCRKYNYKILFDPRLRISHDEHQTTGFFKSRKAVKLLKKSVDYRIDKMKQNSI
jgi:GT2 family glycosyltransferase